MQQQEETWQERHARELKETMNAVHYAWAQLKYADLRDVLVSWAYKLLDETGEDWVNNEGGYGSITVRGFQKEKLEVVTDMNVRVITNENSQHEMEIPMDFDQLMIQAKQQARRVA